MNFTNFTLLNIISFGFLSLFIAFNSSANLAGLLLNQAGFGDLGIYNLAILNIFISLGSIFSSAFIEKLGVKFSLLIPALLYTSWQIALILPALYEENKDSDLFIFN
jgi:hypothetical protein